MVDKFRRFFSYDLDCQQSGKKNVPLLAREIAHTRVPDTYAYRTDVHTAGGTRKTTSQEGAVH